MLVFLGNAAPRRGSVRQPYPDEPCRIVIPDGYTLNEAFRAITDAGADLTAAGLWVNHSSEPPTWAASDVPRLAALLAAWYGCPVIDLDEAATAYHLADVLMELLA